MTPNVNFFIHYVPNIKGEDRSMKGKINFEKRNFFSATNTYNFVEYIAKGSQEKIDFIDYSGNLEKSQGLFDEKGLMQKNDIENLKNQLRKTNSPIWYGLISFEEIFGKTYCASKDPKTLTIFNNFLHLLKEKDRNIEEICKRNKVDPSEHLLFDKYYNDIYKRLGNKVIESLFYMKKLNKQLENDKIKANIKKRIEKTNRSKIWNEALNLKIRMQDETIKCFEDFVKKLDQANYKRLIEEGYIEL